MLNQRRSGAVLSYVYIIVNMLVILVYQPFVLRTLGSSEYGLYQLAASVINYLTVMDLGFGNGIVVYSTKYRAAGRYEEEKRLLGMFSVIFLGIGAVAACAGVVIALNAGRIFAASLTAAEIAKSKILMLILSANVGMTFAFTIYGNIIISHERFVFSKLVTILRVLLNPLIMLPLLLLGADSVAMVSVLAAVNAVCLLSNYIYCRKKLGVRVRFAGFDKKIFLTIFSFSVFIFMTEVVDKINWYVDQAILGVVSGTREVTVYSMASNYNQMVLLVSSALASVMLPKISAMVARGEGDRKLSDEFIKVSRLQFFTVFFIASGFVLFGKEFVVWHAGEICARSYYVAALLICGALIPITQTVATSIVQAKNLFRPRACITLVMALFNVAISIPLAMRFGSVGSAAGTALALVIANGVAMNIYYAKWCGIDIAGYWKNILRILPGAVAPITVGVLFRVFVPINAVWKFIVGVALYSAIYALSMWLVSFNTYEKGIFMGVLRKITGGKINADRNA